VSLAVGKQGGDRILDRDAERTGFGLASVQTLFADFEQDFVQARVRVGQRPFATAGRESNLIGAATKFNVLTKKMSKL
jgi:hypothetical protein